MKSDTTGPLVIIGGAEDKDTKNGCTILREFVRLSGGDSARIVVLTVATDYPEEVGKEYAAVFRDLDVTDIQVVDVSRRADASRPEALEALGQATGVFFTGGDQLHVTSLIGGSPMYQCLKRRHAEGLVVAGTSAGAAMMANSMIIRGESETSPRFGAVRMGAGMDFLPGTVIDTHFLQRGRIGRLIAAVAHYPHDMGLGVDENTALIVTDGHFEVMGAGAVTVVDGGGMTYTNVPDIEEDEPLALHDIRLHILPAGYKFDLLNRVPVVEDPKQAKGSDS